MKALSTVVEVAMCSGDNKGGYGQRKSLTFYPATSVNERGGFKLAINLIVVNVTHKPD